MSKHRLEVAELRRTTWWYARGRRDPVRWWPTTLPGSDHEDLPPRRRPLRRRVRRGRIQLVRA